MMMYTDYDLSDSGSDFGRQITKNVENNGLQPPVDKFQGVVGGFVKAKKAILKPSNLGGKTNDNCRQNTEP